MSDDLFSDIYNKALDLLSRREHSKKEIKSAALIIRGIIAINLPIRPVIKNIGAKARKVVKMVVRTGLKTSAVPSMAASMAAFYHQIEVGHVEAGLRTNNIYSPLNVFNVGHAENGPSDRGHFKFLFSSRKLALFIQKALLRSVRLQRSFFTTNIMTLFF